jgi:glycosyltransferase involved in cell wall biosynthesis
MIYTTVITTYNRVHCVAKAVRSTLITLPTGEVIVVDDASQDDTISYLKNEFSEEISSEQLKILALKKNLGVTGAKNTGYMKAAGDWVIFLDSDDEYFQGAGGLLEAQLLSASRKPIVFFRCHDQSGHFVGEQEGEEVELNLTTYLQHTSFGEALTAVNKRMVGDMLPYPAELRGYEGLGCCRLIKKFGPALLSTVVARVYYIEGDDRLSISKGLFNRMPLLAKGHFIMVNEFWGAMRMSKSIGYLAKATVYYLLGNGYRLIKKAS